MTDYSMKPERPSHPGWQIMRLAGISFIVKPSFLLFIGIFFLFVLQSWKLRLDEGLLVCLVVFLSLLAHEASHALMARLLGQREVSVSLVMLGGNTHHPPGTRLQNLLITVAGPGCTLALSAIAWVVVKHVPVVREHELLGLALFAIYLLNKWWAIFNLMPVYPLDGGQIVFHGLSFAINPRRAMLWTAVLSAVICVAGAIWAVPRKEWFVLYFAVAFFAQNRQIIQSLRQA